MKLHISRWFLDWNTHFPFGQLVEHLVLQVDLLSYCRTSRVKMSVEQQFDAAVKVIRSLPKNGKPPIPVALYWTRFSSRYFSTIWRVEVEVLFLFQASNRGAQQDSQTRFLRYCEPVQMGLLEEAGWHASTNCHETLRQPTVECNCFFC